MKKLIFTVMILGFSLIVVGQEKTEDKHPIDVKFEDCLDNDSNYTTSGMIDCSQIAEADWDEELNRYYKLLMGVLEEDAKAKLRKSQIKWIEYRDLEFDFASQMYADMQGTMWILEAYGRRINFVKARVLEFKAYYDDYTINDN
ncbi:MAG: DUF1311 domain-containing protein [Bacteroidales bacterium]|nr:DUF1311 domain-containing protein [Bacteroidales bacterium]MDD4216539.1 DUF1311 domain-containing protein [Bacteroidales bacterium]MDY0144069.1 lysozyme inhibitor LprI family protein [Bacteroidales bacterium]